MSRNEAHKTLDEVESIKHAFWKEYGNGWTDKVPAWILDSLETMQIPAERKLNII